MAGMDGTAPSEIPMSVTNNTKPHPQSSCGDLTVEGAVMVQTVITDQLSPELAMQLSQEGVHVVPGESGIGDAAATLMVPGSVLQSSGSEMQHQTSLPIGMLQGDAPQHVTVNITRAPERQEVVSGFQQEESAAEQSIIGEGAGIDSAPSQVQAPSAIEGQDVIIEVHQVPDHDFLLSATEGERQMEVTDDSMETGGGPPHDHPSEVDNVQSADGVLKQAADSDGKEMINKAKEVIFVCIHGQSFRCKPQAGIPVESPVEEPTDGCACSKVKKLASVAKKPSSGGVVKGSKLARKLRNRKQVFTCIKCGSRFSNKGALDLHMDAHNGEGEEENEEAEAPEKTANPKQKTRGGMRTRRQQQQRKAMLGKVCPDCGRVFSRLTALAAHKRQHDKEKLKESQDGKKLKPKGEKVRNLSCTVCEKKFTRMYDVERHMETHVDSDRKTCAWCGNKFHTIKSKERHESFHCKRNKKNICSTCQMVLGSKFKLLRHEREHLTSEQMENLSCKTCSKAFTNSDSLMRHERLHLKEKGALIHCSFCPETFEDRFTYNSHVKAHAVKAYQCTLCSMRFKHEYLLNVHIKRMTCQKKRESLRDVSCNICQKVVKGTATLKRHMRTHTKEKPYPCRIGCSSSFSSTSNRLSHERMYCKLSPEYLCTHCGEVLSNQARLIYHESKYHGIGPIVGGQRVANTEYPCKHCGKVFFFKGGRKRHERIHTNEKPYMCQYCPKAFVHASALVCHERVHTKERPYMCHECGKAFSQATHLKTHIRVHTKEKPYKCRFCDKAFSHMGTRKSHEGTHKSNPDPGLQTTAHVPQDQVTTKYHIPQQEQHVVVAPEIKVIHQENEPVQHKIHVSHHEHEVQAADVILQLLESGSRVSNFEGLVHMASSS